MRLWKADGQGELSLTKNLRRDIPSYAILSHTWSTDEEDEVTLTDLKNGSGNKPRKVVSNISGWTHAVSTKQTTPSFAEAITSMFRWYHHAAKCFVFLSDVSVGLNEETWEPDLRKSRWFTRGWTLQELLAPRSVDFFSREGKWLVNKTTLERQLHGITGIPIMALRGVAVANFSVDERLRWVAKRNTTEPEDKAYCLLGIFDVFMSPIYGEGEHAFIRLRNEIERRLGRRVDVDKLSSAQGPNSIWHVPFDRKSGFVGHADELERLKRQIFDPESDRIVSVLGLGGVGKSRLTLELAHQIQTEHPEQSILWVEVTDQLTFERDVLEFGKKLAIPGIADDKADVKMLVKQWLSNLSKGRWLLILDNADDEAIWGRRLDPTDQKSSLVDWLPTSANSFILVTTRSSRVASYLAGKDVVEISAMTLDEARRIFINALEKPAMAADEETSSALLELLTYLPLAIVQAASYMNMTQEPLKTYLELLHEPEEAVVKLLSEDFGDRSRYSSAHKG